MRHSDRLTSREVLSAPVRETRREFKISEASLNQTLAKRR